MSQNNELEDALRKLINDCKPEIDFNLQLASELKNQLSINTEAASSGLNHGLFTNLLRLCAANESLETATILAKNLCRKTAYELIITAHPTLIDSFESTKDLYLTKIKIIRKKNFLFLTANSKSELEIIAARVAYIKHHNVFIDFCKNEENYSNASFEDWTSKVNEWRQAKENLIDFAKSMLNHVREWDKTFDDKSRLTWQKFGIFLAVASIVASSAWNIFGAKKDIAKEIAKIDIVCDDSASKTKINCDLKLPENSSNSKK